MPSDGNGEVPVRCRSSAAQVPISSAGAEVISKLAPRLTSRAGLSPSSARLGLWPNVRRTGLWKAAPAAASWRLGLVGSVARRGTFRLVLLLVLKGLSHEQQRIRREVHSHEIRQAYCPAEVPLRLFSDSAVSKDAKLLMCYVVTQCRELDGQLHVSVAAAAQDMGVRAADVQTWLHELGARGFIGYRPKVKAR